MKEERIILGKSKMVCCFWCHQRLVVALKRHTYRIYRQALFYRWLRQEIQSNECILHVDFAENYACKPNTNHMPFCSLSDNLGHSSSGIWGHIQPVFDGLFKCNPKIYTLHVLGQQHNTVTGCKFGAWNFFEAAHGKDAPGGIVAAMKRQADRLVDMGTDCVDAKTTPRILHDRITTVRLSILSKPH